MYSSDFDVAVAASGYSTDGDDIQKGIRRTMVTGAAVTLPLLVTLLVLGFVLNLLSNSSTRSSMP